VAAVIAGTGERSVLEAKGQCFGADAFERCWESLRCAHSQVKLGRRKDWIGTRPCWPLHVVVWIVQVLKHLCRRGRGGGGCVRYRDVVVSGHS
jgi:hypothetical protein